jgi:hypothetical protein
MLNVDVVRLFLGGKFESLLDGQIKLLNDRYKYKLIAMI